MRFKYSSEKLKNIFSQVKIISGASWTDIAANYSITKRTLFSWRAGKTAIPANFIRKLQSEMPILIPPPDAVIDEHAQKVYAAKKGGSARIKKHGNPGTLEGRISGGTASYLNSFSKEDSIFKRGIIFKAPYSEDLAEITGILLGDGCINSRQVSITLHSQADAKYASYVINLLKKTFGVDPTIHYRKGAQALVILISRTDLVEFLGEIGLDKGSKVIRQAAVPLWISKNESFTKKCIRGLMDTDGCFYTDRHYKGDAIYSSQGLNFTNKSLPLLRFVKESLESFGLHPTQTADYSIFLRRKIEIENYFSLIGSSNPKFIEKRRNYLDSTKEE